MWGNGLVGELEQDDKAVKCCQISFAKQGNPLLDHLSFLGSDATSYILNKLVSLKNQNAST